MYIYIYIYRQRERGSGSGVENCIGQFVRVNRSDVCTRFSVQYSILGSGVANLMGVHVYFCCNICKLNVYVALVCMCERGKRERERQRERGRKREMEIERESREEIEGERE